MTVYRCLISSVLLCSWTFCITCFKYLKQASTFSWSSSLYNLWLRLAVCYFSLVAFRSLGSCIVFFQSVSCSQLILFYISVSSNYSTLSNFTYPFSLFIVDIFFACSFFTEKFVSCGDHSFLINDFWTR